MSLLEDIRAEHEEDSKALYSLARLAFAEMCTAVKQDHGCRPVVLAVVGNQAELHFPTWRTPNEKLAAFARISQGLAERKASGVVCAFSGTLTEPKLNNARAVVVMIHGLNWKKMMVQPYYLKEDKVQWTEPYITNDFDSPLDEISCVN